jgi:hypothetical protein
MRRHLWALLAFTALAGCVHTQTYVKVQEATLGRVIVYRNGIAYYERDATVNDQKLTLHVPGDKVNDFLKSLTVTDLQSGQAMPIAFPQPGPVDANGNVDMTVHLPTPGEHHLRLSYVSEAPAWKPSYRVMVDEHGKVRLQGWAIVDNTSGEDWQSVKVGVGSSSALSFRYDLHSIRMIDREMLAPQQLFAQAPPTGGSMHAQSETVVLAQLDDWRGIEGYEDVAKAKAAMSAPPSPPTFGGPSSSGGGRRTRMHGTGLEVIAPEKSAADEAQVAQLTNMLRGRKDAITIEGFANPGEDAGSAATRANKLRDRLLQNGVAPSQIAVVSRGVVAGHRGVRVVQRNQAGTPVGNVGATTTPPAGGASANAEPVGESHFESPVPLTVRRGTSAMVSILNGGTSGEVVYLYDPESNRGDAHFAFKAVRFTNPSGSTLEAGPMTVYGKGRFIGEGMSDPIPGKSSAMIPFALDRQVVIEMGDSSQDRISSLSKAVRGVFTAELQHRRKLEYKLTNRLGESTTVYVKHNLPHGYKLITPTKANERLGDAHLFRVELSPGQTKLLRIEEETPVERSLDLRTSEAIGLLRVYLEAPSDDPVLAATLGKLLKINNEIGQHEEKIQGLRERAEELRVRMDELHAQIFDLTALKSGGGLLTHLKTKMKEISEQVQKNTLAIVDEQEKMTLVKVQFADGLSDLTLERKAVAVK